MPANAKAGFTRLPDGSELHWSREGVTEEAVQLWREQAGATVHRVVTLREHGDGSVTITKYEVPGGWLHWFVCAVGDSVGEADHETVLTIEAVG